ncbi:MAG: hypothetical protein C0598_10360 [Marinilabiliales bacterium]|nr:MAG: hypothetical protein C0598_10360 [Marinilabiliales bacterium]
MKSEEDKIISFLSFRLGKETFATNVSVTNKILQLPEITKVPNADKNMIGIINHHGNVLPVYDINQEMESGDNNYNKNTCVIILSVEDAGGESQFGLVVDEVLSVDEINENELLPPPKLGSNNNLKNIEAIFKKEDDFIMILNIEEVFKNINN